MRRARGEEGAALVEFALILPLFMMLLLGMFTGAIAYDRKGTITTAGREATRLAATLPLSAHSGDVDAWLAAVAQVAEDGAHGQLAPSASGREVCVALVGSTGPRRLLEVGSSAAYADSACFDDGRPAGEPRVQVVTRRTSRLQAVVFSRELALEARAVSRYEAGS